MANLKALSSRIRSVKNTKQITKAMKMVSAAKLRRAQERAFAARPYSQAMGRMMGALTVGGAMAGAPPLMAGRGGPVKRVELVVFTADRGLCGSFNSGVIRAVRTKIAELTEAGQTVTLTFVGRKAHDVLKRQFSKNVRAVHIGLSRGLTFQVAEERVAGGLLDAFHRDEFDLCLAVYNTFQSAMQHTLTWRQLMPLPIPETADDTAPASGMGGEYEPSGEEVLAALLPKNVAVQIFQAMVESDASEHGARMTAMDNAVRNADEMVRKLTITFNRTRQAAITTELMEIISGAESLKG
ncbi:MAG: F0F1 ATP synthase subunit gamma [Magnetococcales bacterium]|nr:F0F1 ATP synthase subunit gamma [Magnetococcales bacterium]